MYIRISPPSWTSLLPLLPHPTPLRHHRAPNWASCALHGNVHMPTFLKLRHLERNCGIETQSSSEGKGTLGWAGFCDFLEGALRIGNLRAWKECACWLVLMSLKWCNEANFLSVGKTVGCISLLLWEGTLLPGWRWGWVRLSGIATREANKSSLGSARWSSTERQQAKWKCGLQNLCSSFTKQSTKGWAWNLETLAGIFGLICSC